MLVSILLAAILGICGLYAVVRFVKLVWAH